MRMPRYLTKFFKLTDFKYYEAGTIRFGTLESYRDIENEKAMGARLDKEDGLYSVSYDFKGRASDVRLGSIQLKNTEMGKLSGNIETVSINQLVFCAAIGAYSKKLHQGFLLPSAGGYPGDPRLQGYAVFDTRKLLTAIRECLISDERTQNVSIGHKAISYCKTVKQIRASGENYHDDPIFHKDLLNCAVFQKRKFFRPEKEYRYAILPPNGAGLEKNHPPLDMKFSGIKDAIVDSFPKIS